MSSYIQGVTDYLPTLQPFKPDLNFYANVLQAKQSQYDAAHKQISQAYGTLMNSPMLRDGNIQRRDQFFKNVEQNIKKISKLDLSQEQNVNAAMQAFSPLYQDKYIMKDMVYTKQLQNEMARAENFRNCVDPDKCGGQYWEEGVRYMQYQAEDFKNASDDESLSMNAPSYKPFVNVTKEAIKSAKDAGFNISMDRVHGGYIVTDTNGKLLTGTQKEPGILPNYLYSLFKDDQRAMDVFHVQAHNARRDYAKANAGKFAGGESEAEQHYLNTVLHSSIQQLTKDAEDAKNMYSNVETQAKLLKQSAKEDGGIIKDSEEDTILQAYNKILQTKQGAEDHHNAVQGLIESSADVNNLRALRQRVDGIVAMNGFRSTIWNAANEYAMGTQKQDIKADPYALENVRFQHELAGKDYDLGIWMKKKSYEKQEAIDSLTKLGLSPEEAELEYIQGGGSKVSAARLKELKKLGVGKKLTGKEELAGGDIAGGLLKPTVIENDEFFDKQAMTVTAASAGYLKEVAKTLRDKISDTNLSQEQRDNASAILRNVFKGADVNGFLAGDVSDSELIEKLSPDQMVSRYKSAANSAGQLTSKYWNNPDLELERAKVEMQHQTLVNMNKIRTTTAKGALKYLENDLLVKEGKRGMDFQQNLLAYASLLGDGGTVKDRNSAANTYVKAASRFFTSEPDRLVGTGAGTHIIKGEPASEKARKFFLNNYDQIVNRYNTAYHDVRGKSFKGTEEFQYEGGAPAVQKSKVFQVTPSEKLAENTAYGTSVVDLIKDLPQGGTLIPGNNSEQFIQNFVQDLSAGDPALEKYGYTITSTRIPYKKTKELSFAPGGKEVETPEMIRQKITPSPAYVQSTFKGTGAKYDPNIDYSFYVEYPAEKDPTGYAQLSELSGVQGVMNLPGSQLAYNSNKGSFSLKKSDKGGGYFISGTQPVFNVETGETVNIPIDPKLLNLSDKLDPEEAYLQSVDFLQKAYGVFHDDAKRKYIESYKRNANRRK